MVPEETSSWTDRQTCSSQYFATALAGEVTGSKEAVYIYYQNKDNKPSLGYMYVCDQFSQNKLIPRQHDKSSVETVSDV